MSETRRKAYNKTVSDTWLILVEFILLNEKIGKTQLEYVHEVRVTAGQAGNPRRGPFITCYMIFNFLPLDSFSTSVNY